MHVCVCIYIILEVGSVSQCKHAVPVSVCVCVYVHMHGVDSSC